MDTSGGEGAWLARGTDGLKGSLGTTLGKNKDLHLEEGFGKIISNSFSPSAFFSSLGLWAITTHVAQTPSRFPSLPC